MERELVQRKVAVYQDLEEHEEAIKVQEEEFACYRQQVEQFPAEIEQRIKAAQSEVQGRVSREYDQRIALDQAEHIGERKMSQQNIMALQLKIKEQEEVVKHLTHKTDIAGQQTQEIALKALESASKMRFLGTVEDKSALK